MGTPICEDCGLACYACPRCKTEFICACDSAEHFKGCKE